MAVEALNHTVFCVVRHLPDCGFVVRNPDKVVKVDALRGLRGDGVRAEEQGRKRWRTRRNVDMKLHMNMEQRWKMLPGGTVRDLKVPSYSSAKASDRTSPPRLSYLSSSRSSPSYMMPA